MGESYHAVPVALNTISNGFLRLLMKDNSTCQNSPQQGSASARISVWNHPLPKRSSDRANSLNTMQGLQNVMGAAFPLSGNLLIGVSFLVASLSAWLIHERTSKAKHLQFVSGVHLSTYWLSTFLWDVLTYFVSAGLMLAVVAQFNEEVFRVGSQRIGILGLLLVLFGWASVPLVYLLSVFFKSPATGLASLAAYNIISALLGSLVVTLLSLPQIAQQSLAISLSIVFNALSPSYAFVNGVFMLVQNHEFRTICDTDDMKMICIVAPSMPCCLNTCNPFCAYWTSDNFSFVQGGVGIQLVSLAVQGAVLLPLVLLFDSTLAQSLCQRLYSRLVSCIIFFRQCCQSACMARNRADTGSLDVTIHLDEDVDVRNHRRVVERMPVNQLRSKTCLALQRVTKRYGNRLWTWRHEQQMNASNPDAVSSISCAVQPGECFGLLGVNGAGKTTLFRMITGDLHATEGKIYVNGFDLATQLADAQQSIGYCPQFDALLEHLTGRETLQLFGQLRGLCNSLIKGEIAYLLDALHLTRHADQLVREYSGGRRRRLSAAVALVGGMPLICLDEPTTGVDPVSRRRMWNLFTRCCQLGRTIILTSHSMEECEALCSRVSILVNGRLKCIGTCQHLKARFGRGYTLSMQVDLPTSYTDSGIRYQDNTDRSRFPMHSGGGGGGVVTLPPLLHTLVVPDGFDRTAAGLKPNNSCAISELGLESEISGNGSDALSQTAVLDLAVETVMQFIHENFPDSTLVDRHQNVLHYHLPSANCTLSSATPSAPSASGTSLSCVFRVMEANAKRLGLVNYSVSQTTLEQIFIDLAKLQREPLDPEGQQQTDDELLDNAGCSSNLNERLARLCGCCGNTTQIDAQYRALRNRR